MIFTVEIPENMRGKLPTPGRLAKEQGLAFGRYDGGYILEKDVEGQTDQRGTSYTLIYDPQFIGRGFEMKITPEICEMILLLPSTERDIEIFFNMLKAVCQRTGADKINWDGESAGTEYIDLCRRGALDASRDALERMFDVPDNAGNICIFCALNPIILSAEDVEGEDITLRRFAAYLDSRQKWKVFYPTMKFYKHRTDGTIFSTVYIPEDTPTVIPTVKELFWKREFEVQDWFFRTPRGDRLIPFDDLLANVEKLRDYDSTHIVVSLSDEDINRLLKKYSYLIEEKKYQPATFWGRVIDRDHSHKIQEKHLQTSDQISGLNHLAAYMNRAGKLGQFSEDFVNEVGEDIIGKLSGDDPLRVRGAIYSNKFIGKEICARYFKPDFAAFTKFYYSFGTGKGYPRQVDALALEYFGQEAYNSEKFDDEAYLFLPFNQWYIDALTEKIVENWEEFCLRREISPR